MIDFLQVMLIVFAPFACRLILFSPPHLSDSLKFSQLPNKKTTNWKKVSIIFPRDPFNQLVCLDQRKTP